MYYVDYEEIRRKADQIRELCGDDQDTFLDTLDGETDAMDILGGLLTLREEEKQKEKMNKELAATYKQRAECNKYCNYAAARCNERKKDPTRFWYCYNNKTKAKGFNYR